MGSEAELHRYSTIFRLGAAAITFAAVFFGVPFFSQLWREHEADQILNGEKAAGAAGQHDVAVRLAEGGFKDTKAFNSVKHYLLPKDPQPIRSQNVLETYRPFVAVGAAIVAFLATFEASRVFARKRAAQSTISNLGGPGQPWKKR